MKTAILIAAIVLGLIYIVPFLIKLVIFGIIVVIGLAIYFDKGGLLLDWFRSLKD